MHGRRLHATLAFAHPQLRSPQRTIDRRPIERIDLFSYRRSDAGGHAGRLHDRLAQWFDADALFYDTEHIHVSRFVGNEALRREMMEMIRP